MFIQFPPFFSGYTLSIAMGPWLIIPTSTIPMSKHSIAPYPQKMATRMSLKEPADVQPRDRPPCFNIFHTMFVVLFALLKDSSKSAEDHPVRPED